jgi:hypothetical protein
MLAALPAVVRNLGVVLKSAVLAVNTYGSIVAAFAGLNPIGAVLLDYLTVSCPELDRRGALLENLNIAVRHHGSSHGRNPNNGLILGLCSLLLFNALLLARTLNGHDDRKTNNRSDCPADAFPWFGRCGICHSARRSRPDSEVDESISQNKAQ